MIDNILNTFGTTLVGAGVDAPPIPTAPQPQPQPPYANVGSPGYGVGGVGAGANTHGVRVVNAGTRLQPPSTPFDHWRWPQGKTPSGFMAYLRQRLGDAGTRMLVANAHSMRVMGTGSRNIQLDPRRDIAKECGHPEDQELTPWYYQSLYNRNPIGARVVEVMPKECWKVVPEVYEDPSPNAKQTPFEYDWEHLNKCLSAEPSVHKGDEGGSKVMSYLKRIDIQSGIGSFGVLLFGFNDVRRGGKTLADPVDQVMEAYRNQNMYGAFGLATDQEGDEPDVVTPEDYLMVPTATKVEEDLTPPTPEEEIPDYDAETAAVRGADQGPTDDTLADILARASETDSGEAEEVSDEEGGEDTGEGTEQPVSGDEPTQPHTGLKLLFLRVFPQSLVYVSRWDTNVHSPRYSQPLEYTITFNDPDLQHGGVGLLTGTHRVHWTRVLHVMSDDLTSSEVFGVPRMKCVVNEVLNCGKILAVDPEAFYRGGIQALAFTTHPQMEAFLDYDKLKDMYEGYINGTDRMLAVDNGTVQAINPSVASPREHFDVQVDAICIKITMPKRVFVGSERGELASTQDDDNWNDRVGGRQRDHCTNHILVPFVDRLINATVLRRPKEYHTYWPDTTSMSALQKAQLCTANVQALSAFIQGNCESGMTLKDFYTNPKFMGMPTDEAEGIIAAVLGQQGESITEPGHSLPKSLNPADDPYLPDAYPVIPPAKPVQVEPPPDTNPVTPPDQAQGGGKGGGTAPQNSLSANASHDLLLTNMMSMMAAVTANMGKMAEVLDRVLSGNAANMTSLPVGPVDYDVENCGGKGGDPGPCPKEGADVGSDKGTLKVTDTPPIGHIPVGITPDGKRRDATDKLLNSPEVLKDLKIPEVMYHVTSEKNLESIMKNGLQFGAPRASTEGEIRGVYLSDKPGSISKQGGDIGGGKTVTIAVPTKGLNLRMDPEYYYYSDKTAKGMKDYVKAVNAGEEDYALYSPSSIPASSLKVVKNVDDTENCGGKGGTPGPCGDNGDSGGGV